MSEPRKISVPIRIASTAASMFGLARSPIQRRPGEGRRRNDRNDDESAFYSANFECVKVDEDVAAHWSERVWHDGPPR